MNADVYWRSGFTPTGPPVRAPPQPETTIPLLSALRVSINPSLILTAVLYAAMEGLRRPIAQNICSNLRTWRGSQRGRVGAKTGSKARAQPYIGLPMDLSTIR
jgi:hypothetical protein